MLKQILITSLLLLPHFSLSLTGLVMSTGKFWKCPGQPLVFTWLLGFSITGILFVWFWIAIVTERTIRRDRILNSSGIFIVAYIIIIITFLLFGFIWSIVGTNWLTAQSVRSSNYYYNERNLYCHPVLFQYAQVMVYLNLICLIFTDVLILWVSTCIHR